MLPIFTEARWFLLQTYKGNKIPFFKRWLLLSFVSKRFVCRLEKYTFDLHIGKNTLWKIHFQRIQHQHRKTYLRICAGGSSVLSWIIVNDWYFLDSRWNFSFCVDRRDAEFHIFLIIVNMLGSTHCKESCVGTILDPIEEDFVQSSKVP